MVPLLAALLALAPGAHAADLIVDGTSIELGGSVEYDAVEVINGGSILVPAYDGSSSTGLLLLQADSVLVDASSSIVADGAGYRGQSNADGEGPGGGQGGSCCDDAGGGGAHGGDGGDGTGDGGCADSQGAGGTAYGDPASLEVDMGSAGGAAGSADGDDGGVGGHGGGAVWIVAESITIDGLIQADGQAGALYNNDAAGGGAGGGILLQANTLSCMGSLQARGGDGGATDDDGGAGGGGVVKQFWDVSGIACAVDVSPGEGECGANPGLSGATAAEDADWDGDGYTSADGDCDPADASLSPETWWFPDTDGDGYGDPGLGLQACTPPSGYIADDSDCDDRTAAASPDGLEICDGLDNDCDGSIDVGAIDEPAWYSDADGDGYGDPASSLSACSPPSGYVADSSDCDDAQSGIHPGASELCDGVDQDCDGAVDEEAIDAPTWYADADADGWGDPDSPLQACSAPSGHVDNDGDCDDAEFTVSPDAAELCNGRDDDCDGTVDEADALDPSTWYVDADGDGWGDPGSSLEACDPPSGYTDNDGDCDDGEFTVSPDAAELCNGRDDDCDGSVDEADALDSLSWYTDADGDGFGDPATLTEACEAPAGSVAAAGDCDDGDPLVNPDATELCNGVDDDCDGSVDAGAADALSFYADADADGFGDPALSTEACAEPSGYTEAAGDCDDADALVNPDATELCNGVDDDCDGSIDVGATDATTWYVDADGDGAGDPGAPLEACEPPSGYADNDGDCDDGNAFVSPGATELCNGIDDDCDGSVDVGAADAESWHADADADGFGDPAVSVLSCSPVKGYVLDDQDCDDAAFTINPDGTEQCNELDDDCDGEVDEAAVDAPTWYADADGDGFGDPLDGLMVCEAPTGRVADATDCDDASATSYPGAPELCDGADDDCDGTVDEGAVDAPTWYADADGDGYGDPASALEACSPPSGYVADGSDCDDLASATWPGATELCDGLDNDCDGAVDEDAVDDATWYADADGDGFGDPSITVESCTEPSGYVANDSDCDDADGAAFPLAPELCNGIDDDCDGTIDEDDAVDAPTWYADLDGDGFGDAASTVEACEAPSGYVASSGDCDDDDPLINLGEPEIWYDGIDQDCDGNDTDQDGDGVPWEGVKGGSDCDDEDPAVYPGAKDAWYDGVDSDCLGNDDYDADGDGYASASYAGEDCDDADPDTYPGAPDDPYDGRIEDCDDSDEYDADGDGWDSAEYGGEDCDDANSEVNPDGEEIWYDGIDQDCDGNDDDQDVDGWPMEEDCDDTDPDSYPDAEGLDGCDPVDSGDPEDSGLTDSGLAETGLVTGKYLGGCAGCAAAPPAPAAALLLGLLPLVARRRSPRT